MKIIFTLTTALFLVFATEGCVVHTGAKKDNGKHKGWFKNRHNPHHPNTDNPGQQKKKGKKHFGQPFDLSVK